MTVAPAAPDAPGDIDFSAAADGTTSLARLEPLLSRLRAIVTRGRAAHAGDWRRSVDAALAEPGDPTGSASGDPRLVDFADLRARLDSAAGDLGTLRDGIALALTGRAAASGARCRSAGDRRPGVVRRARRPASCTAGGRGHSGIGEAVPAEGFTPSPTLVDRLVGQARVLIALDRLARAAALRALAFGDPLPADPPLRARETMRRNGLLRQNYAEAAQALLGPAFAILPLFRFTTAQASEIAQSRSAPATHDALAIEAWLHSAARVRPRVAELTWAMAGARWCDRAVADPLLVQLPFTADAPWIGGPFDDGLAAGEWLSLVVLDGSATTAPLQAGLLIDDWTETVPGARETTGVAFNFNRPNATAPQALLVAVAPQSRGHWTFDDLTAACTRHSISRSCGPWSPTHSWAVARTNKRRSGATFRCCRRSCRSSRPVACRPPTSRVLGDVVAPAQYPEPTDMPIAERAARVHNLRLAPRAFTPLVRGWNRLEGRPRSADFARSLRAEVRDPLWFLTRQWQYGEFEGEDAGSPIDARVAYRTSMLDTYAAAEATSPYDAGMPLEVRVEREAVPSTSCCTCRRRACSSACWRSAKARRVSPITRACLRWISTALWQGKPPQARARYSRRAGIPVRRRRTARRGARRIARDAGRGIRGPHAGGKRSARRCGPCAARVVRAHVRATGQRSDGMAARHAALRVRVRGRQGARAPRGTRSSRGRARLVRLRRGGRHRGGGRRADGIDRAVVPSVRDPLFRHAERAALGDRGHAHRLRRSRRQRERSRAAPARRVRAAVLDDWCVLPLDLAVGSFTRIDGLVVTDVFGDRTLVRPRTRAPTAPGSGGRCTG